MREPYDHDLRYRLVTVEETTAPDGVSGEDWCLYVIQLGDSKIVSKKVGSHCAITQHANEVVVMLNERFIRGGTSYASRKRTEIKAISDK